MVDGLAGVMSNRMQSLESNFEKFESQNSLSAVADIPGSFRHKLHEFPKFDGSYDPAEWRFKANRYFYCNNVPDTQRVTIASYYLDGEALQWFWHFSSSKESVSWHEFLAGLESRFGAVSSVDSHGQLSKLRQVGTVAAYQWQFETMCNRITGLSEKHLLGVFLSGLREDLACEVRSFMPHSLSHAMELARIQEQMFTARRRASPHFIFSAPQTLKPFTPNSQPAFSPKGVNPPVKKLSTQQLQERKAKGLCYNCDDKWLPGHTCQPHKLFLLHLIPDDSDFAPLDSVDPEPFIEFSPVIQPSLSAQYVTHLASPGTLKVLGKMGTMSVLVLIDNGSTHNFLDPHVVKKLGLSVTNFDSHPVKIAAGLQISSQGWCPGVNLKMPGM